MSENNSGPAEDLPVASPTPAPSTNARVTEWFLRSAAIAEWQRSTQLSGDLSPVLAARSRVTADLARAALTTAEPLADSVRCELYRQSVYWALCALVPTSDGVTHYSESVWALLDDEALSPFAANAAERQALRARLSAGNFIVFAGLSSAEQATCCAAFQGLGGALLARFDEAHSGLAALRQQRAWRIGGLLACLLALLVVGLMVRQRMARHGDLAFGSEWRTSSSYGSGGCSSPDQDCDEKTGWFFHTAASDPDPWIEFDLSGPKSFSAVTIENRDDCCAERDVPLVIEVSDDKKKWRRVATRRELFTTWRATFPTVEARWLRLRLLHEGPLHLKSVHIFK